MTNHGFRKWRESMGWRQKDAAKELGIHAKTISNYERGSVSIPRAIVLATERLSLNPAR